LHGGRGSGAIFCIGGETFDAGGEVRTGRMHDGKRVRPFAFAFVLVFVDRAPDRRQDTRAPSAARTPKAETRAGKARIGSDTARRGEDSLLTDRERLLLLVPLLVISVQVILLLLLPAKAVVIVAVISAQGPKLDPGKTRSGATGGVRWAHPQNAREETWVQTHR
jgi:hypothetical protein